MIKRIFCCNRRLLRTRACHELLPGICYLDMNSGRKKRLVCDGSGVIALAIICLFAGFLLDQARTQPLSLVYTPLQTRLNKAVEKMDSSSTEYSSDVPSDLNLMEMKAIISQHTALILDARPEEFYKAGHIPSALNLPRVDFKNQYLALQTTLHAYQNKPLVVYCVSNTCHASQTVAEALQDLGYKHVLIFGGGWSEWQEAGLPEETK